MTSKEQRVEAVARAIWGTRKDAPDGDYSLRMNLSWDEARRAATNAIASLQPLEDTEEGLREALEPFATCWTDEEIEGAPDDMPVGDALYEPSQPTVGHLRNARAALSAPPKSVTEREEVTEDQVSNKENRP